MIINAGRVKTFTAGEALENNRRVKLSSGVAGQVEYSDDATFMGVTQEAAASGAHVPVALRGTDYTLELVVTGAITVNADFYGQADGKIGAASNGDAIGKALEASTAAGDVIECLFSELT